MRRILVITEPYAYGRGLLAGAARVARGRWTVEVQSWQGAGSDREALRLAAVDGVLGLVRTEARAAELRAWGRPVVNCTSATRIDGLPSVIVDDHALGRLAADHLLAAGLRRLAWIEGSRHFCRGRGAGFRERAAEDGVAVTTLTAGREPLAVTLPSLARGGDGALGVFAYNDFAARTALEICREAGLRVPDEVALLGADDDPTVCETSDPPLSSVRTPGEAVGAAAAELLDALLAGGAAPLRPLLVAPSQVAARASTDAVAAADPVVAQALRYMRAHAAKGIDTQQVAAALALSRSSLERRFRRTLGRGPGGELRRLRVRLAQELLDGSQLPVRAVARMAGFASHAHLCEAFARATGMSPSAWRSGGTQRAVESAG